MAFLLLLKVLRLKINFVKKRQSNQPSFQKNKLKKKPFGKPQAEVAFACVYNL